MTRDQAIEFKNSIGWKEFEKELRSVEHSAIQELIRADEKDMMRVQESIRAIRRVILLPDHISERDK